MYHPTDTNHNRSSSFCVLGLSPPLHDMYPSLSPHFSPFLLHTSFLLPVISPLVPPKHTLQLLYTLVLLRPNLYCMLVITSFGQVGGRQRGVVEQPVELALSLLSCPSASRQTLDTQCTDCPFPLKYARDQILDTTMQITAQQPDLTEQQINTLGTKSQLFPPVAKHTPDVDSGHGITKIAILFPMSKHYIFYVEYGSSLL